MKISPATLEDCGEIAEVHVASWQAAYAGVLNAAFLASLSVDAREAMWRQVLSEGGSDLLVCRVGTSLVGFASFGASRDRDVPHPRGELRALYVHPNAWSLGAGRELWLASRQLLTFQRFETVSLWVLEQNARAIRFYSAAGFTMEPGSARKFELGGKRVREVRMQHAS